MNLFEEPVFIGFIIFEVVTISLWIWAKWYNKKHKYDGYFSDNVATPIFLIPAVSRLRDKKEIYLNEHKEMDNYIMLVELYNILPKLYDEYALAVLRAPLALSKPPSPYSAAQLGTMIGGAAVGMVAAYNAIEKQKIYEQNVKEVFLSKFETGNAYDKLNECYWSMISIIEQVENTKIDWDNTIKEIIDELEQKK